MTTEDNLAADALSSIHYRPFSLTSLGRFSKPLITLIS